MKIFKRIMIGLLILIALPFVVALFVPNTYTVSVSETINQPRQVVYDYVRMLDNQKAYSVWLMRDPNMDPEIRGNDGSVGVVQHWNSEVDDVGEGEQEITALNIDRMDVDLRFKRPFEGTAKSANIFKAISDSQTLITTEFYSDEPYPFNLPSYFFGRKFIEEAQQQNLRNIKEILEKK